MMNEEKYLYPPLEDVDKITLLEGYEEHTIAKRLIKDIKNETELSDLWFAKTKVLKEIIEHHIKEEEILFKFKEELAKMGI